MIVIQCTDDGGMGAMRLCTRVKEGTWVIGRHTYTCATSPYDLEPCQLLCYLFIRKFWVIEDEVVLMRELDHIL
jgi:hypothetical protein